MHNLNIMIGCILVASSVTIVLTLTIMAHRSINRIAKGGYRTARETLKELKNGK